MNIFVVDADPITAATMLCDQHIVKMAIESAQLLSTIAGGPYKPTHKNHPCTLWVGMGKENYEWLARHGIEICKEYTRRYGRMHKCQGIIESIATAPATLPSGRTPFAQAMPVELKGSDAVEAYRRYYKTKTFARWRHSLPPKWYFND